MISCKHAKVTLDFDIYRACKTGECKTPSNIITRVRHNHLSNVLEDECCIYWELTAVSGRGYKIGPVYPSVCVSILYCSHGWTVWDTNLKFGVDIAFGNIANKLEGQGHRSKVKVAILKSVLSRIFCLHAFSWSLQKCFWFCHTSLRDTDLWWWLPHIIPWNYATN